MRSILIFFLQMYIAGWPWPAIMEGLRFDETWRKIRPLLFGASLTKTAPIVDRFWASQAQVGGVTALGLAQQGVGGLTTVLERAISMPLIPTLARLLDDGNFRKVRALYRKRVFTVLVITAFLMSVLWAGRSGFVEGLDQAMHVSIDNAILVWKLVIALTGFVFVSIAGTIVMSVLYALDEMTMATKISVGGFVLGLVLKWAFFEADGVNGLAIAISLSYIASFVTGIAIIEIKLRDMEPHRD